ncbi:MAG: response regulator [Acidimicrobiales bacterium]
MLGMQDLGPPIRVVLVEVDEKQRALLADLIRDAGFTVVSAVGTIEAAEEAIFSCAPDVAVIDGRLPRCGIDLCRAVAQSGIDIALILHIGTISIAEELVALDAGATVVPKSIRNRELIESIRVLGSKVRDHGTRQVHPSDRHARSDWQPSDLPAQRRFQHGVRWNGQLDISSWTSRTSQSTRKHSVGGERA